jgi:predicted nucleotidyltransferase component of viral defense system
VERYPQTDELRRKTASQTQNIELHGDTVMITKNPMQLKALIKKKAAEKNVSAQLVMQNYMLERLLERVSLSVYKRNFILKGGFLISAIVGLDTRVTMDLDTTIKGFNLTHDVIRDIFNKVCKVPVNDDVMFEILSTADIREGDDYPGIRVNLKANYRPISVPLAVDVTAGDRITPCEIEYTFSLMFDEQKINIMVYNLETVIAEKLETVISRGIANTRLRDFYDIYILWKLRSNEMNIDVLKEALEQTSEKRGSRKVMQRYDSIMSDVLASEQMQGFWRKYQTDFNYAHGITFEATVSATIEIMNAISF